ncbi:MAG TPA: hypothetical protein PKL31_05760 [Fulvivirga sp.]|nr:hypothetical protein [Fulvivirga sp.]
MKTSAIFLLTLVLLTACNDDSYSPEVFSVKVNQEFTMRYNDEVRLDGEDFSIKFSKVPSDSRCPSDAMCIWEGQFIAQFICPACDTNPFQLTSRANRDELAIYRDSSFEVILLNVNPYPKTDFQIDLEKYQLTLIIKRI